MGNPLLAGKAQVQVESVGEKKKKKSPLYSTDSLHTATPGRAPHTH